MGLVGVGLVEGFDVDVLPAQLLVRLLDADKDLRFVLHVGVGRRQPVEVARVFGRAVLIRPFLYPPAALLPFVAREAADELEQAFAFGV